MTADRPLYDCVQIQDVLLRDFHASINVFPAQFISMEPELRLAVAEAKAWRDAEYVFASVTFDVRAVHEQDELLKITGTYFIVYWCDEQRDTTDEELEQFGGGTAVFNAWPFWREVVAGAYMRMGLSLPPLPTLSPNLGFVLGPPAHAE